MAAAVPSQTCQLGWHQRSDSWFGPRSGRQRRKCVLCACFYVRCYLSRGPAGVQGWWYGRLGKQEIAGPSRLIFTHAPPRLAQRSQLLWAWDGCLEGQVEGTDISARPGMMCFLLCVCLTYHMKEEKSDGGCE